MFYKFHHHLITIDSEYLPQPTETRSSHRKNNTHSYNIPYCRTQYRQMSFFPPDHPRMEQPAPGNSGSQVPGLFQVQACCPPVTRQTTPPLPPPLLFLMSTTPHLLCHTPFHYISEVSTATSTNQHNHQNIDVG